MHALVFKMASLWSRSSVNVLKWIRIFLQECNAQTSCHPHQNTSPLAVSKAAARTQSLCSFPSVKLPLVFTGAAAKL